MTEIGTIIAQASQLLIPLVLLWAAFSYPRHSFDEAHLRRLSLKFLAPAWIIFGVGTIASVALYRGPIGKFWFLAAYWIVPMALRLLMAHVFLLAGSLWVWRNGLRGRGFGWMPSSRRLRVLLPPLPLIGGIALVSALTLALYLALRWCGLPIQPGQNLRQGLERFAFAGPALDALLITYLLIAPFFEEILFRHFLQSRLSAYFRQSGIYHHWIPSILITSALWSIGHVGLLNQEGFKMAQIFSIGILLGIFQRRWGVTLCIVVHFCLNAGILLAWAL